MDLGTVERKLGQSQYASIDEFASDVRLVFTNAKTYNMEFSDIHTMAKTVEAHFEAYLHDGGVGEDGSEMPPAKRRKMEQGLQVKNC